MKLTSSLRFYIFIFAVLLIIANLAFAICIKRVSDAFLDSFNPNFRSIFAMDGILQELDKIDNDDPKVIQGKIEKLFIIQQNSIDVSTENSTTLELQNLLNKLYAEILQKNKAQLSGIILEVSNKVRLLTSLNRDEIEFKNTRFTKKLLTLEFIFVLSIMVVVVIAFVLIRKRLAAIDASLQSIGDSIDQAVDGQDVSFAKTKYPDINKLNNKLAIICQGLKNEGSLEHDHYNKVKVALKGMVDNIGYPLALFNTNSEIEYCNKQFDRFLEVINKKINSFEGQKAFATILEEIVKNKAAQSKVNEFNTTFEYELNGNLISSYRVEENGVQLACFIAFKRPESLLNINEIEVSIKDALINLNSIHLALHAAIEGNLGALPNKANEFFYTARNDCFKIKNTLNNIIESRTYGDVGFERGDLDFGKLVIDTVKAFAVLAESKNIQIDVDIPPLELIIHGYTNQLLMLLNTLFDNAIKHSPAKEVVTVKIAKKEGMLLFAINNCGSTIPKEYSEAIFDKYFRIPGDESKGEGIGLFLARKIAEHHGGYIWVESDKSTGTTFWVSIKGKNA